MTGERSVLDLDADPEQSLLCIQQREWKLNRTRSEIASRVTSDGKPGTGDVLRDAASHFGLFRTRVRFVGAGRDSRLLYECFLTIRGYRVTGGLQALLILLAFLEVVVLDRVGVSLVDGVPGAHPSEYPLALLVGTAGVVGAFAYSNRGPSPRFSTAGLEHQYTTFSFLHTIWQFVLVVFLVMVVSAAMNLAAQTASVVIVVLLLAVSKYASGTIPGRNGDPKKGFPSAGEPLLERPYPHLNVALLALLPAVLTLLVITFSQGVAPNVPSTMERPLFWLTLNLLVPAGVTLLYCHWCLSVLRRIRSSRIEPYRSRGKRLFVLGGFLLVNVICLLIYHAAFSLLLTPYVLTLQTWTVPYTPEGLLLVTVTISVLFIVALALAFLQVRSGERIPAVLLAETAKYINYLLFFVLFGVLSAVISTFIWSYRNRSIAFWDFSPQSIRTGYEEYLAITQGLAGVPVPETAVYLAAWTIQAGPIFLLAGTWALFMNQKLRETVATFIEADRLPSTDRPIPEGATLLSVDMEQPAVAKRGLLTGSKVLVGTRYLDALDDRELDALLAHEAYHIENRDTAVDLLSRLVSGVFGGQNVLLAFYDIAESERRADEFAVTRDGVTREDLDAALKACRRIQTDRAIENLRGPAFLGSVTTSTMNRLDPDAFDRELPRFRSLRNRMITLLFAPYLLLFGSVIYDRAHLDYDDRRALLRLDRTVLTYVNERTERRDVVLPVETTVLTPVRRSELYAHLRERGASTERIDEAIAELRDGGYIETAGDDTLLRPGY